MKTLVRREVSILDKRALIIEQKVADLEKEIAELKMQVSVRLSVEELATELELYRSKASHKTE